MKTNGNKIININENEHNCEVLAKVEEEELDISL